MDRRTFLFKAIGWALAGTAGFSPFRRAIAMGSRPFEARLAIIIDDIGYNPRRAASFLNGSDLCGSAPFALFGGVGPGHS